MRHLPLALLFLLTSSLLLGSTASAKSARKVSHAYDRVWPTAIRFLRIDEGLTILEKDSETGYVLFELAEEGKRFPGSVEVIRRRDDSKREAVELIIRLQDRPSYMEHAILDRLLLKIREELGQPPAPPKEPAPPNKKKVDEPKEDGKEAAASTKE